jgi:putative ABC transport system permease protein
MRTVRVVIRQLRRDIRHTVGVVLPLALALTATMSMFAIVNQLLLRPPDAVARPSELFRLRPESTKNATGASVSLGEFLYLKDAMPDGVELTAAARRTTDLEINGRGSRVDMELVGSNYFALLGVRPLLGRVFSTSDEPAFAATPIVVLSESYWDTVLGADPSIVGQAVHLNGTQYTVSGVAARNFHGLNVTPPAMWVLAGRVIDFGGDSTLVRGRTYLWLTLIGRRRADVGLPRITGIVAAVRHRDSAGVLAFASQGLTRVPLSARALMDSRGGLVTPSEIGVWLLAMSVSLFVVACLNAGVLLVGRVRRREREFATKRALGARPRAIAVELLIESACLAALSMVVAGALVPMVLQLVPQVTGLRVAIRDPRVAAMAGMFVVLACILPAVIPTVVLMRQNADGIERVLRAGTSSVGTRSLRLLLAAQAAVVVVLLVFGGNLFQAVRAATHVDLGVDIDHLAIVNMAWSPDPRRNEYILAIRDRLRSIPGVRAAVVSGVAPLYGTITRSVQLPTRPGILASVIDVDQNNVEPGYFAAVGMRLLQGRAFVVDDRPGLPEVVIVNQAFAGAYFGTANAIGKCITGSGVPANDCTQRVVGVVSNTIQRNVLDPSPPMVFAPVAQAPPGLPLLVTVRTARKATEMISALRAAVGDHPYAAPIQIEAVGQLVAAQVAPWRRASAIVDAFAMVGLAIAAIGLYAATRFFVLWRAKEYAIRQALGATAVRIQAGMIVERLMDVGGGASVGLVASIWLLPRLSKALHLPSYGIGVSSVVSATVLLILVIGISSIALRRLEAWDPSRQLQFG